MAFNYYDTVTLVNATEQLEPAKNFLRDRYFPTNEATDVFATAEVLMEYKDGTSMIAPFVAPRKGGVTVHRKGYEAKRMQPPRIAPRRMLTIDDLNKKGFGEALMSGLTPEERQDVILLQDIAELSDMITRREEQMAAEVMQTNACIMKHIADDKADGDEMEIKFFTESQNPAKYTPTGNWTKDYEGIVADLSIMARTLTSKGLPATELIVGADVADALLSNTALQKMLDIRNFEIGRVDPKELPTGAALIATLNIKGRIIDVICYEEQYTDFADGKQKAYIDPKNIIMTAPGAGVTAYGAVSQVEADGEVHTYAAQRVPKFISDQLTDTRTVTVTSHPLVMPRAKNAFVVAKVLA